MEVTAIVFVLCVGAPQGEADTPGAIFGPGALPLLHIPFLTQLASFWKI
jgi:hypothetical protein